MSEPLHREASRGAAPPPRFQICCEYRSKLAEIAARSGWSRGMRSALFHSVRHIQQVGRVVAVLAIACALPATELRAQVVAEPSAVVEASQPAPPPAPLSPQPQ